MGCFQSKKLVKIHNNAFDLIDSDGDNKLSNKEIDTIAKFIHCFHVERSLLAHNNLSAKNPNDYIYELIGKSKDSKIKRKDFNKMVKGIPITLWNSKILPALRKKEIARLITT